MHTWWAVDLRIYLAKKNHSYTISAPSYDFCPCLIQLNILDFTLSHIYLVYLWPGYLTELRILSGTMPHTYINCLLGQWGQMQHKWYMGLKSCLIYLAGVVFQMFCPALVNKRRAGKGTLVSISRNIICGIKAAALVTKSYSHQDKGKISFLLTAGQMSCSVQSLVRNSLWQGQLCIARSSQYA